MRIRKATTKDFKEIVGLRKKFYLNMCSSDRFLNPKWAERGLQISTALALKRKNSILLVAEEKSRIVGYLLGKIKKQPPCIAYAKKGVIDNVYIEEEFRRKGIGKKLIREAIAWFLQGGISWIYLLVYPHNKAAYNLYKKFGFREWFIEMNLKC